MRVHEDLTVGFPVEDLGHFPVRRCEGAVQDGARDPGGLFGAGEEQEEVSGAVRDAGYAEESAGGCALRGVSGVQHEQVGPDGEGFSVGTSEAGGEDEKGRGEVTRG